MRGISFLVVIAAGYLATNVDAFCANDCSGNGRCSNYAMSFAGGRAQEYAATAEGGSINADGVDTSSDKKDTCNCYLKSDLDNSRVFAYGEADCSRKTCPSGNAHFGLPYATNDKVYRRECSGAGKCAGDGTCQCMENFEGAACNRVKCPNDCSKRGKCMSLHDIVRETKEDPTILHVDYSNILYSLAHDAFSSHGCVCDMGSSGYDCSITTCQSSTNPMGGKGSESARECSGQGICDRKAGTCQCNKGFSGPDCSTHLGSAGA